MVITYYGKHFFKVQLGDSILAINPIGKDSKLKGARFGADIALVSLNHPDFNGADQVVYGDREPFAIKGPGEYEVKGVSIKGFGAETLYKKGKYWNTSYLVSLEGMTLLFIGALSSVASFPPALREALEEVDILFIPVGGGDVLGSEEAGKLVSQLEPKLIIPVDYEEGEKKALEAFLKEEGAGSVKPEEKLTIKKKELEGKDGEVVVLSPQS